VWTGFKDDAPKSLSTLSPISATISRRKRQLSQKSVTVAEFGDYRRFLAVFGDIRRFWRQSHFSATVAVFGDSVDRA